MNRASKPRVVIVDDHPLFRRGVVALLKESDRFIVLDDFENAQSLIDALDQLAPSLALIDLHMPDMAGLELLKVLKSVRPDLRVVILTASDESDDLLEALAAGADGYLRKDTHPDEILSRLEQVLQGQVAINDSGVTLLARHLRNPDASSAMNQSDETSVFNELTDREQQTLALITKGMSNKLIARELGISDGTVKVYVKNILRKLNLHSRLELAAWAHSQDRGNASSGNG
jgi:two-component system nitrate/nitrite response regulator NarL